MKLTTVCCPLITGHSPQRQRAVNSGQAVNSGYETVGSGQWTVDSGQWIVDSG
jgi:hypothetical protein